MLFLVSLVVMLFKRLMLRQHGIVKSYNCICGNIRGRNFIFIFIEFFYSYIACGGINSCHAIPDVVPGVADIIIH